MTQLISRADLDFLLYDWLKVEKLFDRERFADHSRDTIDPMLDLAEALAESEFLSHYKKADREEPRLVDGQVKALPEIAQAYARYTEAGFSAAAFDADVGGLQLPFVISAAATGQFMAANLATSGFLMLTGANARVIAEFATPPQVELFAMPEIEGRYMGTMCLSEPQAGSSLSYITTRAVADGEDEIGKRYRLTGNKMWISAGDHDCSENIVHLVLAKIPGPDGKTAPGTRDISVFIVPKLLVDATGNITEANDIAVAGLNHKMGYRGTPNCLLNFGEGAVNRPGGEAGAVGYLVGEAGQGLSIMFHMMNEARISVGLGAAAVGYRGYRLSLQYAKERAQGRPLALRGKDPGGAQIPIIEHADMRRMLLAQKSYVEGALALVLYAALLVDEERTSPDEATRAEAARLLAILTPVAKSWPSEWGLVANDIAIQIHGGYGYTRDFDVEQLYRDNRLNPIHEGTVGIHGLDLLGQKILRDGGVSLALLRKRIDETAACAAAIPDLADYAASLKAAWARIAVTVEAVAGLNDYARALDNATIFLSAFGHATVAWLWLDQAVALAGRDDSDFALGKRGACRYFYQYELPKIGPMLDIVASFGDAPANMKADWF